MAKKPSRADSGETGLIQKHFAPLAAPGGLGLTDDAACIAPDGDCEIVLTVDTIVEGVHFLPTDLPSHVAIKGVSVNLSDLVAKGASLLGYLVALSLPGKPTEQWIGEFARGLGEVAKGKILGGDITSSKGGPLTVSITAIGQVPKGRMVRRSGAKPGDLLFITGAVGTKAAGLRCALDPSWGKSAGLVAGERDQLIVEYAAPMVPFADLYADTIRDHATASMDVSDGLAIDLSRLCDASGAGAMVQLEDLPLNPIVRRLVAGGNFLMRDVITGGDDYVALFTAPASAESEILGTRSHKCHRIGTILEAEKGVTFLQADGSPLSLGSKKGYDHFSE